MPKTPTNIEDNVNKNVTSGVGVGNTKNDCSCTKPPVITASLVVFNKPNCFKTRDNNLSAPMYSAQALAAQ